MRKFIYNLSKIALGLIIFLLAFTSALLINAPQLELQKNSSDVGDFSSRLLAITKVENLEKNNLSGTILIRLSDGESVFFEGDNNVNVSSTHPHAALYSGKSARIVIGGKRVAEVNINSAGDIEKVQFSPSGEHVAISSNSKGKSESCIVSVPDLVNGRLACNNMAVIADHPYSNWLSDINDMFVIAITDGDYSIVDTDAAHGYRIFESEQPAFNYIKDRLYSSPLKNKLICYLGRCFEKNAQGLHVFKSPAGFASVEAIQTVGPSEYEIFVDGKILLISTKEKRFFELQLNQKQYRLTPESEILLHDKEE